MKKLTVKHLVVISGGGQCTCEREVLISDGGRGGYDHLPRSVRPNMNGRVLGHDVFFNTITLSSVDCHNLCKARGVDTFSYEGMRASCV